MDSYDRAICIMNLTTKLKSFFMNFIKKKKIIFHEQVIFDFVNDFLDDFAGRKFLENFRESRRMLLGKENAEERGKVSG